MVKANTEWPCVPTLRTIPVTSDDVAAPPAPPAWVQPHLGTSPFVGITECERLPCIRRGAGSQIAGWVGRDGEFHDIPLPGESRAPVAVHPTAERVLWRVGAPGADKLYETDLDSGSVRVISDHPDSSGLYVGTDLLALCKRPARQPTRLILFETSGSGLLQLDEANVQGRILQGPWLDRSVFFVVAGRQAECFIVKNNTLELVGAVESDPSTGYVAYEYGAFEHAGKIYVPQHRSLPPEVTSPADWFELTFEPSTSWVADGAERIADFFDQLTKERTEAVTATSELDALSELIGQPLPPNLLRFGPPVPNVEAGPLPPFTELLAAENSFEYILRTCSDPADALFQVFTNCYLLGADHAGRTTLFHLPPSHDDPVMMMGDSGHGSFGIVAYDLPSWAWIEHAMFEYEETNNLSALQKKLCAAAGRFSYRWITNDRPELDWLAHRYMRRQPSEDELLYDEVDRRAGWLWYSGLSRGAGGSPELRHLTLSPDEDLAAGRIASYSPHGLYWLWRTFALREYDALDRVLAAADGSPSRLVRDAAALVKELRAGRDRLPGITSVREWQDQVEWTTGGSVERFLDRLTNDTSVEHLPEMLDHGVPVDLADHRGRTMLHVAAGAGHERLTRLLLERGCDPRAEDHDGRTPLQIAQGKGRPAVVELLTVAAAQEP